MECDSRQERKNVAFSLKEKRGWVARDGSIRTRGHQIFLVIFSSVWSVYSESYQVKFDSCLRISNLLQKFQGVAYRADGRNVLLIGLNEFLHDSMVLPPGAWDDETMLPAMRLLREKEKEKERRKRMLDHSGEAPIEAVVSIS